MCNGCTEHYDQFGDIVIQHEEYRSFTNLQTGLPAKKFGNAYYHCRLQCISLKWPGFHAQMLGIGDDVKERLTGLQRHCSIMNLALRLTKQIISSVTDFDNPFDFIFLFVGSYSLVY